MGFRSRMGLAIAVALGGAVGAAEEPPGPGVTLRFAWPERMEGRRVEKRQGRQGGEVARQSTLTIERHGAESWLLAKPAAPEEEQAAADRQDPQEPPLVVGADGRFVRLDGLEALAEQDAAFQVGIATSKAEAEAARKAARERMARLAAEAREQWTYQVEAWLGRTLQIGFPLQGAGRVPVATVPGLEVEQRVTLAARRWVACAPGGIDRDCLELALKADAGPDAFRKGLAAAGGKAAKGFEDGSLAVEVTLVTDPKTLLPRRWVFTRKLRLVFAGRDLSVDQVERREIDYQWWKG